MDKRKTPEFSKIMSDRMKAYWAKKSKEDRLKQGAILKSNNDKRLASIREAKSRPVILKDFKELGSAFDSYRLAQKIIDEELDKRHRAKVNKVDNKNTIRDEVVKFSLGMEQKLRKRDGYGGWRHLPLEYLERKLMAELNELAIAIKYESPEEVMSECVDVANFVMFIWDVMRSKKGTREGLVRRNAKDKAHG